MSKHGDHSWNELQMFKYIEEQIKHYPRVKKDYDSYSQTGYFEINKDNCTVKLIDPLSDSLILLTIDEKDSRKKLLWTWDGEVKAGTLDEYGFPETEEDINPEQAYFQIAESIGLFK